MAISYLMSWDLNIFKHWLKSPYLLQILLNANPLLRPDKIVALSTSMALAIKILVAIRAISEVEDLPLRLPSPTTVLLHNSFVRYATNQGTLPLPSGIGLINHTKEN
jgi:hypothetical protein